MHRVVVDELVMDLTEDWRRSRYVLLDGYMWEDLETSRVVGMILLCDHGYWHEHARELEQFCALHGCVQEGMFVKFYSAESLTVFGLAFPKFK